MRFPGEAPTLRSYWLPPRPKPETEPPPRPHPMPTPEPCWTQQLAGRGVRQSETRNSNILWLTCRAVAGCALAVLEMPETTQVDVLRKPGRPAASGFVGFRDRGASIGHARLLFCIKVQNASLSYLLVTGAYACDLVTEITRVSKHPYRSW